MSTVKFGFLNLVGFWGVALSVESVVICKDVV